MFNVPQWMIEEFKIVEIIETGTDYAIGLTREGIAHRFERSLGSSIAVTW